MKLISLVLAGAWLCAAAPITTVTCSVVASQSGVLLSQTSTSSCGGAADSPIMAGANHHPRKGWIGRLGLFRHGFRPSGYDRRWVRHRGGASVGPPRDGSLQPACGNDLRGGCVHRGGLGRREPDPSETPRRSGGSRDGSSPPKEDRLFLGGSRRRPLVGARLSPCGQHWRWPPRSS